MNATQLIECEARALQGPMNAVIDLGTSDIQRHYDGSTILITGATGFLGQLMIEKMLRSCNVRSIYILIREKKGVDIKERLESMFSNPLYDILREKKPNFSDRIIPINGDLTEINLGISPEDWTTITKEVDTIFHFAATTRFNEPLRKSTLINVRGTREILKLGKECKKLRSFVHVSTAYSSATRELINGHIREQFYPCPIDPETLIKLAEDLEETRLNNITKGLIDGWPNIYAFTKIVAEELVRKTSGELPICVVRPPIVCATYYEPQPGWLEKGSMMGPSGLIFGLGVGVLHILYSRDVKLCYLPGDFVTNATIAVGWDNAKRHENRQKDVKIYTMSNIRSQKEYSWGYFGKALRSYEIRRIGLSCPISLWWSGAVETENRFIYWLFSWLLHYIPAYIIEAIFYIFNIKKPKEIPSFVKMCEKMYTMGVTYSYFTNNEFYIHDENTAALFDNISESDKAIFNFDIHQIDWKHFISVWCIGVRKYIVKDGLRDVAYPHLKMYGLFVANYVFLALYIYVLYAIVMIFWNVLSYLIC